MVVGRWWLWWLVVVGSWWVVGGSWWSVGVGGDWWWLGGGCFMYL